jgi:S1-C subfamily serine protease
MDQFGVQKPELKAIARTPVLPGQKPVAAAPLARDTTPRTWLGASIRNIADMGEMSAFGLPGVTGVLVLEVPPNTALAKAGLQKNDVILSINGDKIADVATLLRQVSALTAGQTAKVGISRTQRESTLLLTSPTWTR